MPIGAVVSDQRTPRFITRTYIAALSSKPIFRPRKDRAIIAPGTALLDRGAVPPAGRIDSARPPGTLAATPPHHSGFSPSFRSSCSISSIHLATITPRSGVVGDACSLLSAARSARNRAAYSV